MGYARRTGAFSRNGGPVKGRMILNTHKKNFAAVRLQAIAAVLLLGANQAFAAMPQQAQAAQSGVQQTQPAPDAPSTAANGAATLTLAQQAQQLQQQAVAPPKPFHIEMPHSRNPIAPYRPSTVPPLDLTNSPRLGNLIRDGKIYISLNDAIALA